MIERYYRAAHPMYGSDRFFDDYTTVCKVTMDLAMQETKRRLDDIFEDLTSKLSDEMIETVVEISKDEYLKSEENY